MHRTVLIQSHGTVLKTIVAVSAGLFGIVPVLRADTVTDPQLGFTLSLSDEFVPRPDLVGATPDIVHAFEFGQAAEGEVAVLLLIEKMGGVIGRERLDRQKLPPGLKGGVFITTWQGFEVDAVEVPESVNGIDVVTYNVQIPLKSEAIQVKLFGRADQKEMLRGQLRKVLDGLNGESNWLSSAAPKTLANSKSYGTILLCVAIGGVIAGLILLWLLSRHAPKGTVLLVAVAVYAVGWQTDHIRVREVRMLSGAARMLGFAGGMLGLYDLVRKRRPEKDPSETVDPE